MSLDGIGYRSSYGDGHNIALFDVDAAEVVDCKMVRVTRVEVSYS